MTPNRLPLLAWPLMFVSELKTWWYLWAFAIIDAFKNGPSRFAVLWGAGVLVLICAFAAVRYWRFSYVLGPDAVTINAGLFVKTTRHIPYANIQTLSRQQWFFLRPFGLESLRIETAGRDGKDGEGALFAVPMTVGDALEARRQAASGQPAPAAEGQQPQVSEAAPHYQIDARDLNLYAVTSLGFLPLLGIIAGIYGKFDDLIPKDWRDAAYAQLAHLAIAVLVALIVVVLLASILVSYLNLVQRYYRFELRLDAQTLITTRGFFRRSMVSVRLARLQALRLKQSVLRQWLHLTSVQALVASNADANEPDHDLVVMPVVPTPQAYAVMHRFVAWLPASAPTLSPVPRTSCWYYIRNELLTTALIALPLALAVWRWLPHWLPLTLGLVAGWLLLSVFQALYDARHSGVAIIDNRRLLVQTGSFFSQSQYVVRRENVQSLTVANSIWMQPGPLRHLRVNVRRGDGNQRLSVRYLSRATVQAVQAWYQPQDA